MMESNYYNPREFIFLGITSDPDLKVPLFVLCLIIYLFIVLANLGMIILIRIETQLHLPMYFFLSHMSFCDLCYPSAIGPKMLLDFFAKDKSISFTGCALQMFFDSFFGDSDCLLLAVMAFDRYMAISNPLFYTVNVSSRVCYSLITGVYMVGLTDTLIHTTLTFTVSFYRSKEINHFFCDIPPLLSLSCSDTQINELMLFIVFGFSEMVTISEVLISYCYIFLSVLKIHSTEGRSKAFSTCSSHITVFTIFQGTVLFMYFRPSSTHLLDQDKMTSLFYTLVIPMLNPLIYSLRNKDVKKALGKLRNKLTF
ncbi:olfactory receptor 5W2-like [Sarcophilus harrisii]|uniref:olfactory receptor 5W2-like n=1 Tax=Sarcophilus harrisii TaxID=9305 RepID=UPI000226CE7B|nr:olfactory receptor 5W2-like [Sarcophilus harrisii]